jgi:hypothetical protein
MKLHIGVDSQTGLAHSAVVTAANVHDKHSLPDLLDGQKQRVYGDCAHAPEQADPYQGTWGRGPDQQVSPEHSASKVANCDGGLHQALELLIWAPSSH